MKIRVKVWLEDGGELVFGRGRAALLEAIDRNGSISAAARKLGMSYRKAWSMLKASESRLGCELLKGSRGGKGGGGTALTQQGRELLETYRRIEEDFEKLVSEEQTNAQTVVD